MAIFKCKMCGGTIEFEEGASVGVCDSCGTKQTLPKTKDESVVNLFNRANNLRLKCEFDKASAIYEKIIEQDDSEAEAHWCNVLCKYGIEYVDDVSTGEKIPTCHRTLFESVITDVDYQAAVDYSDSVQQAAYETEARTIDKIQKDILEIVKNEKPFDVFICYKETDENGQRTKDSVIANDIYYQLTQEGFKVFYAAITLEDKLGKEYEPYIFAALNSAKVMLVVGTDPMYFNAVWVKNEWSRYMKLMKTDRSKLLIPCYRDMDAYELPDEFAHLQAQDMGKIGFVNDVVRGIRKVFADDTPQNDGMAKIVASSNNANAAPLLERAFIFLEDGKWQDADIYCEKVLDIDPKNVEAYLGKLMAELHVNERKKLADCAEPFENRENYAKVIRFGDDKIEEEIRGYISFINERNEKARIEAKQRAEAERQEKERIAEKKRKEAEVGSTIYFGTYEQDSDTSNGKKDIEWRVLAREDNKILVISEHVIDCKEYNTKYTGVTWETCSLRRWLNTQFINSAFRKEDQAKIITTNVPGDYNQTYGTNPGNTTKDKVFLLSYTETQKYFSSNEDRRCILTPYALKKGAEVSGLSKWDEIATCMWWVRTPGEDLGGAVIVHGYGHYKINGTYVDNDCIGVRPALWISLE